MVDARNDDDPAQETWRAQLDALGGFIRAQRQLADLSLREMSTLTKVSNAYLSQVERGLHQPSLTVLRSIAGALGLSTEQLLSKAGWRDRESTVAPGAGGDETGRDGTGGATGPVDTEGSIRADPRLTDVQREALLGVYRSFVEGTA